MKMAWPSRRATHISWRTSVAGPSRFPARSNILAAQFSRALPSPWCSTPLENLWSKTGLSRIDYFALVDAQTLEPRDALASDVRLIAAAVIGATRLIDNLAIQDVAEPR